MICYVACLEQGRSALTYHLTTLFSHLLSVTRVVPRSLRVSDYPLVASGCHRSIAVVTSRCPASPHVP